MYDPSYYAGYAIGAFIGGLFLTLLLWAAIGTVFGLLARNVAMKKGYNGTPYFWLAFFLNVMGLLVVVGLPDRILQSQNQQIIELLSNRQ